MFPRSVTFLLCPVFASALLAQSPGPIEAPGFSLSPADLARLTTPPTGSAPSDVLVLLDDTRWTFDANGRSRETSRTIFRVLSQKAVEGWGSLEETWEPWHEVRPSIRARVITPDGVVHELDPKTIADAPAATGEASTYSDKRVVECPLPAVTVGAIVEEEVTTEETQPLFAAGTVRRIFFGRRDITVMQSRVVFDYPDSLPFRYTQMLLPDAQAEKQTANGRTTVKITMGTLQPVIAAPPLLPSSVARWPQVVFSTGRSWTDVSQGYYSIVESRIQGAALKEVVAKATQGKSERNQKISALVRSLHQQVRYTGIEFGEAAIVPATPTEVLKRKYGDCKDKASVLVAMLREAGIPAYVALLSTGPGQDLQLNHPGMGLFHHAIVFVPGSPDIWIDATADLLEVGGLPSSDQDRLALIVRPETAELVRTPELPAEENKEIETREFFLADYGPAKVIETTKGTGSSDEWQRSNFGSADTSKVRKNLTTYMRNTYLSDAEATIEHPSGDDFSKPFYLKLTITGAKRGSVDVQDAAVGVNIAPVFNRLPAYFTTDENKDANPDAKPRTEPFIIPATFSTEWHYIVYLPDGYRLTKAPAPMEWTEGPAHFVTAYSESLGLVEARIELTVSKRQFTTEEAAALKAEILKIQKMPLPLIALEPFGVTLVKQGKIREGIAEFNKLSHEHPDKAIYHSQLALVLLEAGIGERARTEAREATGLEPKSSYTWQTLGYVLLNDMIGRQLTKGFDLPGSEDALRKAVALDPKDDIARRNLAVALEYDNKGRRYEDKERLAKAIEEYRGFGDRLSEVGLTRNLLFDLAYSGRFSELKTETEKIPNDSTAAALRLVAVTALDGSAAAIAEGEKSSASSRSATFETAANVLQGLRRYLDASQLLAAAADGSAQSANLASRAGMLKKVKPFDPSTVNNLTPEGAVVSFFALFFSGDEGSKKKLLELVSEEATRGQSEEYMTGQLNEISRASAHLAKKAGVSQTVFTDLTISLIKLSCETAPDGGVRARISAAGPSNQTFFLSKEKDGHYRLLGFGSGVEGVGRHVLALLKNGNSDGARFWLDWAREEVVPQGGDDPLVGVPFTRLWTKGQSASPDEMRVAAAALVTSSDVATDIIPVLRESLNSTSDDTKKGSIEWAYALASIHDTAGTEAVTATKALTQRYPSSSVAAGLYMEALANVKDWSAAEKFGNDYLSKQPADLTIERQLISSFTQQGKFKEADALFQKIVTDGKATAADYNNYGWNGVVAGHVTTEQVDAVEGYIPNNRTDAPLLHTMAAMYAEIGKTREARAAVLEAMSAWGLDEPNGAVWLIFGLIAEEYGMNDAAISAYHNVKAPLTPTPYLNSTNFAIANAHIEKLSKPASMKN